MFSDPRTLQGAIVVSAARCETRSGFSSRRISAERDQALGGGGSGATTLDANCGRVGITVSGAGNAGETTSVAVNTAGVWIHPDAAAQLTGTFSGLQGAGTGLLALSASASVEGIAMPSIAVLIDAVPPFAFDVTHSVPAAPVRVFSVKRAAMKSP